VLVGSLNWGLVGLMNMNLVTEFIKNELVQKVIYVLIGLSSLYKIFEMIIPKN
jgi:uncharacterized membrane protein YuzA (DUF378 family)